MGDTGPSKSPCRPSAIASLLLLLLYVITLRQSTFRQSRISQVTFVAPALISNGLPKMDKLFLSLCQRQQIEGANTYKNKSDNHTGIVNYKLIIIAPSSSSQPPPPTTTTTTTTINCLIYITFTYRTWN